MTQQKAFTEGEVFLAYIEKQPSFFARIENIAADNKKGWWQFTFVILSIPLTTATWIIDDDQIRGAEFTMGGIPVRLERIVAPKPQNTIISAEESEKSTDETEVTGRAKILSFSDVR